MSKGMSMIVAGALLAAALPAFAHHSYAMFNLFKEQVMSGVVTEFQWTNPHTWIEMDVTDGAGKVTHWSIEAGSVVGLRRQGWKPDTVKPGDRISVVVHPLKTGQPGGSLIGVVTADGRQLGEPLTPAAKAPGGAQ